MDNSKKYSIKTIIPLHVSQEHKDHSFKMTRRSFGNQIYDILYNLPQPVVVSLKEEFSSYDDGFSGNENYIKGIEFSIHMKCTPVEYRHVVIEYPEYIPRKASFLEKLKWLFSK